MHKNSVSNTLKIATLIAVSVILLLSVAVMTGCSQDVKGKTWYFEDIVQLKGDEPATAQPKDGENSNDQDSQTDFANLLKTFMKDESIEFKDDGTTVEVTFIGNKYTGHYAQDDGGWTVKMDGNNDIASANGKYTFENGKLSFEPASGGRLQGFKVTFSSEKPKSTDDKNAETIAQGDSAQDVSKSGTDNSVNDDDTKNEDKNKATESKGK